MMGRTLGIIKFGSQERIKSFLAGEIYMNTLGYFADLERDPLRADPREGDGHWFQEKGMVFSIETPESEEYIPINGLVGPIRFSNSVSKQINVFCMYGVDETTETLGIDNRVLGFGESFTVITNGDAFMSRLRQAATEMGQSIDAGRVKYVEELKHHGPVGPFTKISDFEYQSEFRIAMRPGFGHPITLNIGDIRDIAVSGNSSELRQQMHFTHPDSK